MSMADGDEIQFVSFQASKDYFAPPLEEEIVIPEDKKDDPYYLWGMEVARKAFEKARREYEEKIRREKYPWEM